MDLDQFVEAFRREHARSPFCIMNGTALRQCKTELCPIVAVANGQFGGMFTSSSQYVDAARYLGLSPSDADRVMLAADVPYNQFCRPLFDRLTGVLGV